MARKDSAEITKGRDDLKVRLVEAALRDFSRHGEAALRMMREDSLPKYLELIERLAGLETGDGDKSAQPTEVGNAPRLSAHGARFSEFSGASGKQ